jgi:Dolichyl-phosphate-mannose-protein mannosyltransferase
LFNPRVTATIAGALGVFYDPRVQDLHPPTYHLLANLVLRAGFFGDWLLVPRIRALAALFGVAAVVAMYFAARQAFDVRTALTAAGMIAVSPYAVMLSREARNYSAATLAICCSAGCFLALARRLDDRRPASAWWVAWSATCAIGLYVHYFTLFAFVAEAIALAVVGWRARSAAMWRSLPIASAAVIVAFLPWIPTLVAQQASPEQRWLTFAIYGSSPWQVPYRIASAFQTMLLGKAWDFGAPIYGVTRGIALVVFLCVLIAIVFTLRSSPASAQRRTAALLFALAALMILEYVAAMVLQHKDFVSEVRYQYAYYVPFAIGVAWVFSRLPVAATVVMLAAGFANSVMVDLDRESWKGTDPPPVLARLNGAPEPTLFIAGSGSFNETVVYETILYEFLRRSGVANRTVAVVERTPLYASFDIHANPRTFWDGVERLRPDVLPAAVMVHSSGMLPDEYRNTMALMSATGATTVCTGQALDDPAFATDNTLIRPLYRRYECARQR